MKILLVAPLPPPDGGMATSTLALVNAMQRGGAHAVDVVDISIRWRRPMDAKIYARIIGGGLHAIQIRRRVLNAVRQARPDVVEIANCGGVGPALRDGLILRSLRRRAIPTVLTFHTGRLPRVLAAGGAEAALVKGACSAATATVVFDESSRRALSELPNRLWTGRRANFVNLAEIDRARQKNPDGGACDVVFVGWVAREKGVFELIQAASNLDGVRLKLVGPVERATESLLRNMAGKAASRIEFTGAVEHDRVYSHIAGAKILALPSYTEAFPYVILEAMALKKPVIATGVAAIPDILEFRTARPCGCEVAVGDAGSLQTAMAALLADENARTEMGQRGYDRVRAHYVEGAVIPEIASHWGAVAEKSRRWA